MSNSVRRRVIGTTSLAAAMLLVSNTGSFAQGYPTRPITIIVPQAVGSASDNVIRPIAQALSQRFGQPVVVENRGAAAGLVGMSQAARADPDGHSLVVISNTTVAANPSLYKKLPYDPKKDFAPIAILGRTSMMFVVQADSGIRSLEDLLAESRRRSAPLTAGYGSSTARVALQLLTSASGMTVTTVPYQGTPQLMNDLLGRNVEFGVVDAGAGVTQARGGKVRPLAISGSRRFDAYPQAPTLAESYPGAILDSWIALAAPAGTPRHIIAQLHEAITQVADQPEVKKAFAAVSIEPATMTTASLEALIRSDSERWPELIRAAGILAE